MNWKGFCSRKRSWPNFKVLSWNSPGGTEVNHKNLNGDSWSLEPRFEPGTSQIRNRTTLEEDSFISFNMESLFTKLNPVSDSTDIIQNLLALAGLPQDLVILAEQCVSFTYFI
jgi:hypothetical protein